MRMILLLALGMCSFTAAVAETKPKFQVGAIVKGRTQPGTRRVNGEYPTSKPTLEFTVTPTEDIPMKELMAVIYFFDENNQMVFQRGVGPDLDRLNIDWSKTQEKMEDLRRKSKGSAPIVVEIETPKTAQAGKKYYFQHVIREEDAKWRHVVVVAGRRDADLSGRVYPKTDLKILNFPDKSKVTYWYQP